MDEKKIDEILSTSKEYKQKKDYKNLVNKLLSRLNDSDRNGEKGKFQNTFDNKIKIAIQYETGGTNYWDEAILNRAFNDAVRNNFEKLLEEAKQSINDDFEEISKKISKIN